MSENGDVLRALQEYAERRREREAKERALASLKVELAEAEKRDEDNTLIQELQTQIREAELEIRTLNEECIQLNRVFRSDPVKATKITGEGS